MGRRSHIDWQRGRTLYVHSGLTQSDVARELGVSVRAVQRHSTAESWPAQRHAQAAKTLAIADESAAAASAEQLAEASTATRANAEALTTHLHDVAGKGLELVSSVIAARTADPAQVSLEDAIALLALLAKVIEEARQAQSTQATQAAQGHTTNLIVALQSLGAQGRVAIYRHIQTK